MHELVGGEASFVGETLMYMIAAVLTVEPLPLKNYWPEVPSELQWIVGKALRKDRDERDQTHPWACWKRAGRGTIRPDSFSRWEVAAPRAG